MKGVGYADCSKIDNLITKLTELKPALSDDTTSNEKRFNELLTASIATNYTVTDEAINVKLLKTQKLITEYRVG